ncbi:MAG: hypothetical protein U0103_02020 [Candidatus Obscuribacterales bacterium]|nr:hypothetical protein [Cyanobacteria bacterium SZAS LIN-5]RTL45148.1 MAG: hypothetical protein EKK48_03575 [Candidatus Melainabacteria bacterium]
MAFKKFALIAALAVCSATAVNADESKTQVIASASGVSTYSGDPTLQHGIKLILEAQVAREQKLRRQEMKPAPQERVVRTHKDLDGVMILGGSASLPM